MPRNEKIHFVFDIDVDGHIEKLMSATKPHTGLGGEFLWELTNNTGITRTVSLKNFAPRASDYLKFNPKNAAVEISADPDDNVGFIRAKVIKAQEDTLPFTYEVWVDGSKVDPELEIDGGGGDTGEPKVKKKSKKKKK